ncbi:MAG: hypothetical protein ACI9UK_001669 [Candidatus Krumholzibacteriia bacterium]|jgi:hypothetical protein
MEVFLGHLYKRTVLELPTSVKGDMMRAELTTREEESIHMTLPHVCGRAALALLIFVVAVTPTLAADRPHNQVIVEFGVAIPYGDAGQDYTETELGFGATSGLELGFRWRYHFSKAWSLSPAFHFIDYRNFNSTDDAIGDFRISTSSLRYTVELMRRFGRDGDGVRPFLAASGGLYRNRVIGYNKTLSAPFDESLNTLGLAGRAGVVIGMFEISAMYNMNRFSTYRLFQTGEEVDYNFDNLTVRAAWVIPFTD